MQETGLSGTLEIKKADGSVITLQLTTKDNSKEEKTLGEKQNGDTSTSNADP
jgi:hypothetical protein